MYAMMTYIMQNIYLKIWIFIWKYGERTNKKTNSCDIFESHAIIDQSYIHKHKTLIYSRRGAIFHKIKIYKIMKGW